jgi:hypothetical protein
MIEHTRTSVTSDGVHFEHSPDYHLLYLDLMLKSIDALVEAGERPPRELEERRDAMLENTVYLLQPNLTFPQFGDTENNPWGSRIRSYVEIARRQGADETILGELEWLASDGKAGAPPRELDRVWDVAGYAAFRDRWGPDGTTGHFKCNHLSVAHYHKDEGTIEIFAHGTELIVDAGKYDYNSHGWHRKYQADVFAHNVLIVDDASYDPPDGPHIRAHGGEGDLVWAQATHDGYAPRGIRDQVRTFAFAKPDEFVVSAAPRAHGRHRYAQHFHLLPALTDVRLHDARTVIATGPGLPVVVLAAAAPARASLEESTYFPSWGKKLANTDVVFRQELGGGEHELPVVITIAPPGAEPRLPDLTTSTDRVRRSIASTPRRP